ncbi:MAG: HesA/MoeB/ThiF family protein [Thermoprotei archaeon]|nr:HesA/MoeB/ThiF family protein [Thermoprotei archaeon]
MELSSEELIRYDRQIRLLGREGQRKLKNARVLVIGLGGLGSIVATYLTVMGVGELILMDKEKVELNNLNRQILHWTKDIGRYKVHSAKEKLREMNPNVSIEGLVADVTTYDIDPLVGKCDVVMDCLDNWRARLLLNDACVRQGVPLIHAGVRGTWGQLMVILPGKGPCLRCLMPREPKEEGTIPILGVTPAVLASLEVLEAVKLIMGKKSETWGYLVYFNGESMDIRKLRVARNPHCPVCGDGGKTS